MQKVEAEVIYEGYKISKQDITGASVPFIYVKSSDGEVENVYCFNLRLTYPPTQWEGTNYPKYKKKRRTLIRWTDWHLTKGYQVMSLGMRF